MKQPKAKQWVPTLYLLQGLPFALVASVSMIFFKNFQISNTEITFYTSLLTLPWFLKPVFSPFLEGLVSKRNLVLMTSFINIGWLILLTFSLQSSHFFLLSLILFFMIALTSSIYDMSSDALYIFELDKKTQARFIGIRTICYQLGRLMVLGGFVYLASRFFNHFSIAISWQITFALLAALLSGIFIYHYYFLPKDLSQKKRPNEWLPLKYIVSELKNIPALPHVILFILLYQFSENQLIKILPLFLLDKERHGGLNLSTSDVSLLIGVIGISGMLLGVLLSSHLLTKWLRGKVLLSAILFATLINIGYLLLSMGIGHSFTFIAMVIFITQFAYGISNGAYMFYLLNIFGNSIYSMSLYAIGTALMGFSALSGGAISGYLQSIFGYQNFFIWILGCNVIITCYCYSFIKQENKYERNATN